MKSVEYQVRNWVKRPQSVEEFFISPMFEDQVKALQTNDTALFAKPDDRGNSSVPLLQLRGIPLSDQWLVRLGFENVSDEKIQQWKKVAPGKMLFHILRKYDNAEFFNISFKDTHIPILYVHQLQNLYRSLAGEDLQ
jgi:hypothetical protein